MAKRAIQPTYQRSNFLPKLIGLAVVVLFLVLAVRHPAEAGTCVRVACHLVARAVDAFSTFVQSTNH